MKAVRIHQYGGPEVVKVEDVPRPEPGSDQVLIKVLAAGVNPVDWKIRAGYLKPAPLPFTLGLDLSGTIEVAGTNASFAPGDEVYGHASLFNGGAGSFAEFALA